MAAIGEVSAGIAHEMRNPLLSICSASEMLLDSPNHDAEDTTLARVIHTEARALETVIREFLLYARPPGLRRTQVHLNDLIQKICREAATRKAFEHPVLIKTDLAPDLPKVYLDEGRLSQVIWNLIQNAGDALDGVGTIWIRTRSENTKRRKRILITVEDSGGGVDPELADNIFKPFFTTKEKGLGLGLALVQQAVESHQGNIRYEQTPKGARFTILLPLIS